VHAVVRLGVIVLHGAVDVGTTSATAMCARLIGGILIVLGLLSRLAVPSSPVSRGGAG